MSKHLRVPRVPPDAIWNTSRHEGDKWAACLWDYSRNKWVVEMTDESYEKCEEHGDMICKGQRQMGWNACSAVLRIHGYE